MGCEGMKKLYLITGGAGHIASVLISRILPWDVDIRTLELPGRRGTIPPGAEVYEGDITVPGSMAAFFDTAGYDTVTLIHCAGRISIASEPDPLIWQVNVDGTENVLWAALASRVDRVIYVSSVHAIPEKPAGEIITEVDSFSADLVCGQYAQSKAAATQLALDYYRRGLNLSVVHPSGVIGPGDKNLQNNSIRTLHAMYDGRIPVAIRGGYDFVDSRDVVDGILACEELGRAGECYILSGHYITILDMLNTVRRLRGKKAAGLELPYGIAKAFAPAAEWGAKRFGEQTPFFTPSSVSVLHSNGKFSHEKASATFGYVPRDISVSIRDSL